MSFGGKPSNYRIDNAPCSGFYSGMDTTNSDHRLIRKAAAHGLATVLGSPVSGLTPQKVAEATKEFHSRLLKAAARENQIVGILREHLVAAK